MATINKNKIHHRRYIRAQIRDIRVLIFETQSAITLFIGTILISSVLLFLFYASPETHQKISLTQAIYAAFNMVFF